MHQSWAHTTAHLNQTQECSAMYKNETGYAEIFDICPSIIKSQEDKAAAIQQRLDHLKRLSLPFANSAVLNCSVSVGGSWAEHHPPICPAEIMACERDLEAYKVAERVRLLQPEKKKGEVIALNI
jgi:hypothetical protein